MALFVPLPAIPHLKITDMGLVDVDKFVFVRDGRAQGPGLSAYARVRGAAA
jgi:hypothetical protein